MNNNAQPSPWASQFIPIKCSQHSRDFLLTRRCVFSGQCARINPNRWELLYTCTKLYSNWYQLSHLAHLRWCSRHLLVGRNAVIILRCVRRTRTHLYGRECLPCNCDICLWAWTKTTSHTQTHTQPDMGADLWAYAHCLTSCCAQHARINQLSVRERVNTNTI